MSFNTVLEKYRKISFSERDKGDRFERLMQAYLRTDPTYSNRFKKVWLWSEFHGRRDLGGGDTGIDLVALTNEGDYWAIQCKCFREDAVIDKAAVDTFLSTSSRQFKNEELKTVGFAHRLWISTTNHWGSNAEEAIRNQHPPVSRLNLYELQQAPVDWEKLDQGIHGEPSRNPKKALRPHQQEAVDLTHQYFKTQDRGKLIMACGTGKTYTALSIAENETKGKGLILFLVPSIALLGQALREWYDEASEPLNAICICSDPEVSKRKNKNEDNDNLSVVDLALPASTNTKDIVRQLAGFKASSKKTMTVVFSTYQSIDVVARAQKAMIKEGLGDFDLVICDEAHRTTGVSLANEDESAFTKIHNNSFIKAKKRLYMTATPRLYSDDSKSKAAQADAVLCSMDDVKLYGEEIYRIGFGKAVDEGLLTDYKVLILTLSDQDVPPAVQRMIADESNEITSDDASKLIGCVNALSKQVLGDEGLVKASDPDPMRRAVAFCQTIRASNKITSTFNTATEAYISSLPIDKKSQMVSVASKHIDGTMSAPQRDELMGWLKSDPTDGECRVLTNVRCLSEGVDVPSLDAVMFLSARNSQIDVVQSVGRVMRKAPGKNYGYIIIPVVVPSDIEANKALDDNERYKVVWTVLNALRAHDDRFNATINKIELNKKRPPQIIVGRPDVTFDQEGNPVLANDHTSEEGKRDLSNQIALQFEQLQSVVFARMVHKVGDKRYWEQWAKNVAEIAERQVDRINRLRVDGKKHQEAFNEFLEGLQQNINPSITQQEAVDMLSQHIITKPVFEALFEGYSFVRNNPISVSMQKMLDLLEEQALDKDTETLQRFYDSVKMRASGIDNAEGRQRIIVELYDKFFKTAFPKMVEKLGIVYTPVEVVDFIINSVNDILQQEFGRNLSDERIHLLEPFAGTGTFVTRLLQSKIIDKNDLHRKYHHEIHANEIVLLAYYIAAVNIENAFHDVSGTKEYVPFDGICLTDTFQLGESSGDGKLFSEMFAKNSSRVVRQQKAPLTVIMGNPPYSIGQKSANDNAQNQRYENLDRKIGESYAKESSAGLNRASYDPYIKAFRWSTDRLDPDHGGIICFVTNGAWLDASSLDGFRKCVEKEFSQVFVFNLRGNQRTSGELSRREGGKIFGSGSRTPIAISLMVKNPKKTGKATIHYYDIGDYLTRDEKLSKVKSFGSMAKMSSLWRVLKPNVNADWIVQRSGSFGALIPLEPENNKDPKSQAFFSATIVGVHTARDAWTYNYSREVLERNMKNTVAFYNEQQSIATKAISKNKHLEVETLLDTNPQKISWSAKLRTDVERGRIHTYDKRNIISSMYRPFTKSNLYFNGGFVERPGLNRICFPTSATSNVVICVSQSPNDGLSLLIANCMANYHFNGDTHCLPLYYFEEREKHARGLFDEGDKNEVIRRDGITDFIFERAKSIYGKSVKKEDIFYYVYGFLHSRDYRSTFAEDLRKALPRIHLIEDVRDFWKFSKAGRSLAELHLNYESVPPLKAIQITGADSASFKVEKMRFPKKDQTDTILFNSKITIQGIPRRAYDYKINGRSAIEWIMDRYQIRVDSDSGIINDPNDWSKQVGNPRYILDLLLSVINVSVQTVDIVEGLPKLTFE
jgi:predicted helicase